jgi:hypothetical protein
MNINNQDSTVRYKTMLCKHYETSKGCVYKDKCQFAHGGHELRQNVNFFNIQSMGNTGMNSGFVNNTSTSISSNDNKKQPNLINYKIVKCKNFEKGKT